jgi:tRNA A-37 threonylcarbamoyl transferase component Bud32
MTQSDHSVDASNRFCSGGNDYSFFKSSDNTTTGYYLSSMQTELQDFLSSPAQLIASARLLKNSRTTTAGVVNIAGKNYFLKRYNNKGLIYTLKYIFRRARPFRSLPVSKILDSIAIPCPIIVAALAHHNGIFLKTSYLLTEFIDNLITPAELVKQCMSNQQELSECRDKICTIMTAIHHAGIYHGDMKLSNIVSRRCDEKLSLGLWDFDGSRIYHHQLSMYLRTLEVSRLISSWIIECRNIQISIDTPTFINDFVSKYEGLCGAQVNRRQLDSRIKYLCGRIRRHK